MHFRNAVGCTRKSENIILMTVNKKFTQLFKSAMSDTQFSCPLTDDADLYCAITNIYDFVHSDFGLILPAQKNTKK